MFQPYPPRFVADESALEDALRQAKLQNCPHCSRTGTLVGHGLLVGCVQHGAGNARTALPLWAHLVGAHRARFPNASNVATARRPPHFLRADSDKWPDALDLVLHPIEAFGLNIQELRELVLEELKRLEAEAHGEHKRLVRRWLGIKKILRASPYERATSFETLVDRNPTFAVGRNQPEAYRRAVAALRTFRQAYREALFAWRNGVRDVVFPAYTLAMRIYHGVRVAIA